MHALIRLVFVLFLHPSLVNAKPLTLILDWLVNPNHAAIFVALEQGFFQKQGLDVNIIVPADPDDGVKLVAAGRADLAITYQPQLLVQVAQGLPLIRIATLIDKPLNCLVVRKNSGIHSIAQLKGKKIGYTSNIEGTLALEALLGTAGLTLHDVEPIHMQYNLTQALLSNRVDAIINVMRNVEPLQLQFFGQPVTLFPVEDAMPSYDALILVTHKQAISDPRIKKFLIALQQASTYLFKNPEQSWQLFIRKNPTANNRLTRKIWDVTLSYLSRHPAQLDQSGYQNFADFLYAKKIISKKMCTQNYAQ